MGMDGPRTLLLIDGHHGVRTSLACRLMREPSIGTVAEAGDLAGALHEARAVRPDVMLVDPNTVGGEPSHVVRSLAALGRPVVVLTASIIGHEAHLLHEAGAAALLLKGVRFAELLQCVEQAVAGAGG
jgi:DNA-binding NarL/FixJ family response regulator